ncbi:MAG: TSUP family transporter [Desulfopila sp.]
MEIAGYSVEILTFLLLIAIVAGCIDTLAGGGGLIVLPALILAGIPPHSALATNKLQGSMGTATATLILLRQRRVEIEQVRPLMLWAFCGSAMGTVAVQFLDTRLLSFVIPVVLAAIAIYFLLAPQPHQGGEPAISTGKFQSLVVPAIGWYDGMFGPGTGSFFALAGVSLQGQGLIEATAIAKTLNFATNIASLIIFLLAGKIVWLVGLLMMIGQMLGAWAGSQALFVINPRYLRFLVVIMGVGMLCRYLFFR